MTCKFPIFSVVFSFLSIFVSFSAAQPEESSKMEGSIYQIGPASSRPNALIEITNWFSKSVILQKNRSQFHGMTPLREAPWTIESMTQDAFIVSPLREEKMDLYLSIYGSIVYDIQGPKEWTSFALYFSVPAAYADPRYHPWFGLEIRPKSSEERLVEAWNADCKGGIGLAALNSSTHKFSHVFRGDQASSGRTLRVENDHYRITAKMKLTSNTTATIAVNVLAGHNIRHSGSRRISTLMPTANFSADFQEPSTTSATLSSKGGDSHRTAGALSTLAQALTTKPAATGPASTKSPKMSGTEDAKPTKLKASKAKTTERPKATKLPPTTKSRKEVTTTEVTTTGPTTTQRTTEQAVAPPTTTEQGATPPTTTKTTATLLPKTTEQMLTQTATMEQASAPLTTAKPTTTEQTETSPTTIQLTTTEQTATLPTTIEQTATLPVKPEPATTKPKTTPPQAANPTTVEQTVTPPAATNPTTTKPAKLQPTTTNEPATFKTTPSPLSSSTIHRRVLV